MFVFLPSLSNILGKYMARPIRKTSGTGIYHVLRYALSFGAGVRQFSRLTGISFGAVDQGTLIWDKKIVSLCNFPYFCRYDNK